MTIGQNIRSIRKQRGLTQSQLGAACRISGGAISSYENGATIPKRRVLERIAAALNVPASLLTGTTPPAPAPEGGGPLYDGVLASLRELYGVVEGRILQGENGACRRYYVVSDSFILYEDDINAIVRSAKATMAPLARRLQSV